MKLIIEKHRDGCLYVYRETEKHHKQAQKFRKNMRQIPLKNLENNCDLTNEETPFYIVADLK